MESIHSNGSELTLKRIRGAQVWMVMVALVGALLIPASALSKAPLDPVVAAKTLVTQIAQGEFAEAHASFAPAVKKALSLPALASTWASLTTQLGAYKGQIGTSLAKAGPYTKVRVSCEFERIKMDIEVTYDQQGQVVSFMVKPPVQSTKTAARAQTPQPPFPYESTAVAYPSLGDPGQFSGTLTRPKGALKVPAVLLITGSGLQDRDSTVFGHKPFAVLADHLTRAGLAVLRVDDRGVGQTTVSPQGSTIQKHVQDAASGLAFLRNRPEIDAARVGLIGHSEGALIAASLASQSKDVAFVVMLAGQGISGAEINPLQVEASLRAQGSVSEASVKAIVSMQRELMKMLARGAGESELMTQLKALQSESLSLVPKAARAQLTAEILNAQLQTQLKAISSPWFRSFVSTEPGPILAKVSCPILALIGSKDIQVPAGPNLAAIRAALAKGANTQSVLRELAGLNHLFQEAKTGAVSEYQSIAETFNTLALSAISNWLRQTTKLN